MRNCDVANAVKPLVAKCRSRGGGVLELPVLDLSLIGCMLDRRAWSIRADERFLIKLQGLSYQPATALWIEDERVGVLFEQPLYESVYFQLREACTGGLAA